MSQQGLADTFPWRSMVANALVHLLGSFLKEVVTNVGKASPKSWVSDRSTGCLPRQLEYTLGQLDLAAIRVLRQLRDSLPIGRPRLFLHAHVGAGRVLCEHFVEGDNLFQQLPPFKLIDPPEAVNRRRKRRVFDRGQRSRCKRLVTSIQHKFN